MIVLTCAKRDVSGHYKVISMVTLVQFIEHGYLAVKSEVALAKYNHRYNHSILFSAPV